MPGQMTKLFVVSNAISITDSEHARGILNNASERQFACPLRENRIARKGEQLFNYFLSLILEGSRCYLIDAVSYTVRDHLVRQEQEGQTSDDGNLMRMAEDVYQWNQSTHVFNQKARTSSSRSYL
jgi:hypothetical protein